MRQGVPAHDGPGPVQVTVQVQAQFTVQFTVQFAVQRGKTPKATMRKLQVEASRPKVHPPIVITDDFRRQLVRHMSMQAYSGGTWKRN